jgi:excinuclease ABC subunit A
VIDLGPQGGEDGGRVIATGTPESVARETTSATGNFLSGVFGKPNRHEPAAAS